MLGRVFPGHFFIRKIFAYRLFWFFESLFRFRFPTMHRALFASFRGFSCCSILRVTGLHILYVISVHCLEQQMQKNTSSSSSRYTIVIIFLLGSSMLAFTSTEIGKLSALQHKRWIQPLALHSLTTKGGRKVGCTNMQWNFKMLLLILLHASTSRWCWCKM